MLDGMDHDALLARERELAGRFAALKETGGALDLTRGKPGPDQLALADDLETMIDGDYRTADGTDVRNYGGLIGIPEARRLGAALLDVPADDVIAGGNGSLILMYQYLSHAWFHGPLGPETAWRYEPGPLKFLCVVPGYDRHFSMTAYLGFELINIGLTADGPDMDRIESLVAADPGIKGIWCVPKYSNPTGHTYTAEVVDRFARLATRAGPNFRIMWDNAYAVHDLDDDPPRLANVRTCCRAAGTEDSVIQFASTSKMTRAGAGVSFLAASEANRASFAKTLGIQSIGPDKLNQLRHVRFLETVGGIGALMRQHASLLRPKFELVRRHLTDGLAADGIGSWTTPRGGYFLSFEAPEGLATAIVRLAADAGVKLTPAGATFPYGRDPRDTNIRIAPTFPTLDDIDRAMQVFVTTVALAAVRQRLEASRPPA